MTDATTRRNRQFFHETLQAYPQATWDHGVQTEERTFPIQGEHGAWIETETHGRLLRPRRPAGRIPWRLAVCAYNEYTHRGHGDQTLERLAERGGWGWTEFAELFSAWAIRQGKNLEVAS